MEQTELSLQQVQTLHYEMLVELDELLRRHGIDYVLGGGTLLGAVRHRGFIPWDDDIDIMMLREEYERMLDVISGQELKPDRRLISNRDRSFARHYARYVRTDYLKRTEFFREDDCPWPGIDIFPVDFVSADDRAFRKQVRTIQWLRRLLLISVTENGAGKTRIRGAFKDLVRPAIRRFGSRRIVDAMEKAAKRFDDGSQSEYVASICGMYGLRERWKYEDYMPRVLLTFRDGEFPAPKNYHIYLSNLYGDYMKLPPEDKRKYPESVVYANGKETGSWAERDIRLPDGNDGSS